MNCPNCNASMSQIENNMGTETLNVCFPCDITVDSDGGSI